MDIKDIQEQAYQRGYADGRSRGLLEQELSHGMAAFCDVSCIRIISCEDSSVHYLAFPDGLRLISQNGKYVGWYACDGHEAPDFKQREKLVELPTNLMAIPVNADFGTVLNCAVRYAIGRQTYMPGLVIDFIRPLLPFLDDNTLWVLDKDIEEAARISLGDPIVDAPKWRDFHQAVKTEMRKMHGG